MKAEQQMDDATFREHMKKIESMVQPVKVVHKLTKKRNRQQLETNLQNKMRPRRRLVGISLLLGRMLHNDIMKSTGRLKLLMLECQEICHDKQNHVSYLRQVFNKKTK